jgi:hypothetical protein
MTAHQIRIASTFAAGAFVAMMLILSTMPLF